MHIMYFEQVLSPPLLNWEISNLHLAFAVCRKRDSKNLYFLNKAQALPLRSVIVTLVRSVTLESKSKKVLKFLFVDKPWVAVQTNQMKLASFQVQYASM